MADAPWHIESAIRRAGLSFRRLRYEVGGGVPTIRRICFGVFFIDAPWSGPSRTSFAKLTEAIGRLDTHRQLEVVVVGIDESPGLGEITDLYPIGGAGETAWVYKGTILKTARVGQNVVQNTEDLLARERCPVVSVPWPTTVIQLADALSNGQDCGFALHDALLDAGHSQLAEHFRQEQTHPKGCWVLDLLLGSHRP